MENLTEPETETLIRGSQDSWRPLGLRLSALSHLLNHFPRSYDFKVEGWLKHQKQIMSYRKIQVSITRSVEKTSMNRGEIDVIQRNRKGYSSVTIPFKTVSFVA